MHRLAKVSAFTTALLVTHFALAPLPQALAQHNEDPVQQQLDAMRREMDALRHENQAMRQEIDNLRAATQDDWLTEARANEIKAVVADVLADADTRASLLQDGLVAGWSEHFFLASPDGRFKLALDGLIQTRFVWSFHDIPDRHRHGWENPRTRLTFRGHVFNPDIEYLVRGDFQRDRTLEPRGGGMALLDAWVRFQLNDEWSLRVGQFKMPFNREDLVLPAYQLAVERSVVDQNVAVGRSQGIELGWQGGFGRASVAVHDGATAAQGLLPQLGFGPQTNTAALAAGNEWAVTGRYEHLFAGNWRQFDDFTSPIRDEFGLLFGIAGHAQKTEFTTSLSPQTEWFGWTADLSMELGGANLFASFSNHYVDHPSFGVFNIIGVVGQAGVYVAPKWELFARGEWIEMEGHGGATAEFPDLAIATAGFNYYIDGHDLKFTTDIGWAFTEVHGVFSPTENVITGYRPGTADAEPQIVFRTQFQLLF